MTVAKVRQQRILKHGSPYFLVSVGELVAGATDVWGLAAIAPEAAKYEPLDYIEVTNLDSSASVRLVLDGQDAFAVSPSMVRAVEDRPFRQVRIVNSGATTIAAGLVSFLCQRQPIKVDSFIRRFVR